MMSSRKILPWFLHPLIIINFLIGLYSYIPLPFLLQIEKIPKWNIIRIILIGISANIFYTLGFISIKFYFNKYKIKRTYFICHLYKKKQNWALYIFMLLYILFIMYVTTGNPYFFITHLDQRQLFMRGYTFLLAPLFILKYNFLFEFISYLKNKNALAKNHIILKFLIISIILGLFGRFFVLAFFLEMLLFYYLFISPKNIRLTSIVVSFLFIFVVIFIYGLYRFYMGIVHVGSFHGTFWKFISSLNYTKLLAILFTNFFDGADILNKFLILHDSFGLLYGKTFLYAMFKIFPVINHVIKKGLLSEFLIHLKEVNFGQAIYGLIPEIFINFSYIGIFVIFFLLGFTLSFTYYRINLKPTTKNILIFIIFYINVIQTIRNGSANFVTWSVVDFLSVLIVQKILLARKHKCTRF